jgi:hypothetical protein
MIDESKIDFLENTFSTLEQDLKKALETETDKLN